MFLFAAASQAYPLQPEPVEGGPSYTTQPTNAVLQRLLEYEAVLRECRAWIEPRVGGGGHVKFGTVHFSLATTAYLRGRGAPELFARVAKIPLFLL